VRRSCHTIAGAIGFPLSRSHRIVVSRWFVMPIAATSAAVAPAWRRAPRFPNLARIVFDPAGLWKGLRQLALIERDDRTVAIE
jgi:hypothetical protein